MLLLRRPFEAAHKGMNVRIGSITADQFPNELAFAAPPAVSAKLLENAAVQGA